LGTIVTRNYEDCVHRIIRGEWNKAFPTSLNASHIGCRVDAMDVALSKALRGNVTLTGVFAAYVCLDMIGMLKCSKITSQPHVTLSKMVEEYSLNSEKLGAKIADYQLRIYKRGERTEKLLEIKLDWATMRVASWLSQAWRPAKLANFNREYLEVRGKRPGCYGGLFQGKTASGAANFTS
jgi:hypothetical protein